jgi:hypothetical protein
MSRKTSGRLQVAFSAGVVAVVGVGLLLVLLSHGPGAPTPIAVPTSARASPVGPGSDEDPIAQSQSPLATPPASVIPTPTAAPAAASTSESAPSSSPTPYRPLPEIAPDFTLKRAGGGKFTLADQLAQGPVVLVFFQRCG